MTSFILAGCGLSEIGVCTGCGSYAGTTDGTDADASVTTADASVDPIDANVTDTSIDAVADAADSSCTTVTHDNGKGQHWQDCTALGTHDLQQALKACAAYDAGPCHDNTTGCGTEQWASPSGSNANWEYEGVVLDTSSIATVRGRAIRGGTDEEGRCMP